MSSTIVIDREKYAKACEELELNRLINVYNTLSARSKLIYNNGTLTRLMNRFWVTRIQLGIVVQELKNRGIL